jgi:hypothetical protein
MTSLTSLPVDMNIDQSLLPATQATLALADGADFSQTKLISRHQGFLAPNSFPPSWSSPDDRRSTPDPPLRTTTPEPRITADQSQKRTTDLIKNGQLTSDF